MQNQDQTPLQQPASNLQPNANTFQQSTNPVGGSSDAPLNQLPRTQTLTVQSAETDPNLNQTYVPGDQVFSWPLALLIVLVIVVGTVFLRPSATKEPVVEPVDTPPPPTKPKKQVKKKSTRRQRTKR